MAYIAQTRGLKTRRRRQRGAAMAEMALVLPVYFMFCWSFFLFSFILFGYCNATYASKIAARYAAFHGSTSYSPCTSAQLKAIASQYLWGAPANGATVTTSWPNGSSIGSWVTVEITITYTTGIPFSSLKSVTIGTAATEMILQ